MGGAPDCGDPPAKELESGDCCNCPSDVFMVSLVRLESVDCGLVIDADKHCSTVKFGAICVNDYCMVQIRLQPFFVEFFHSCRFVWVR